MPPKAGHSMKNATNAKHTKIMKKWPPHKNARTIKKPGKNSGLNLSLNSDASQVGISAEQPQPPVSYSELISLIDSEDMEEDSQEDEMEEDGEMEEEGEMEEDEFFGQLGQSQDHHFQQFMQLHMHPQQFQQPNLQQFMQPSPCPQQFQQPDLSFQQPGPSQDYRHQQSMQLSPHPHQFQQPDLSFQQPAPFPFIPPELESRETQQFSAPMPTTFRNIGHMQESNREQERAHYSGQLPINLPGIRKVFVYDPRRPPEERRGQLFQTGVIKATGDITITVPLPSQRDLPPMRTTPLPITTSPVAATSSHPYTRQCSTNEELKRLMEAAKSNMCLKILLENAMPETHINVAMAEAALSAASQVFMSGIPINQIPRHKTCLKTLCTLTTTIQTAFKTRAHRKVPTHYDLNHPSDANAEVTHRQQRVPPLVENHTYLFADERYEQGSLSPVNHPCVSAVIIAAVWETALHEELDSDLDDVDSLNNLYSLGGAATHSVLMEHFNGRCQTVDFQHP